MFVFDLHFVNICNLIITVIEIRKLLNVSKKDKRYRF